RPARARVVHPAGRRVEGGAGVRRPVLVAHPEQLAHGTRPGADAARELVAGDLPAGVRRVGRGARPEGAGVRRDVRGAAGRPEDGVGERVTPREGRAVGWKLRLAAVGALIAVMAFALLWHAPRTAPVKEVRSAAFWWHVCRVRIGQEEFAGWGISYGSRDG